MLNESNFHWFELQEDFRNKVHELSHRCLACEMGHVLTKAKRQGIIPKGQGMTLLGFNQYLPSTLPRGSLRASDGDFIRHGVDLFGLLVCRFWPSKRMLRWWTASEDDEELPGSPVVDPRRIMTFVKGDRTYSIRTGRTISAQFTRAGVEGTNKMPREPQTLRLWYVW